VGRKTILSWLEQFSLLICADEKIRTGRAGSTAIKRRKMRTAEVKGRAEGKLEES
jgi:hypothetical protein